jgi:hypothetical protein
MSDRVTITLNELHCEAQSESGGCEPYLFTSFYAVGPDGQVEVTSPKHADVRGAFADDIEAGTTLAVPQEIGTCDLPASGQLGIVALVIDEDMGRNVAVDKAHAAFHSEVEAQRRSNAGQIDRDAILSKVRGAVHGTYDYSDLHRDQDDLLGVGVHQVSGSGPFELQLGITDDRFILRGEVR